MITNHAIPVTGEVGNCTPQHRTMLRGQMETLVYLVVEMLGGAKGGGDSQPTPSGRGSSPVRRFVMELLDEVLGKADPVTDAQKGAETVVTLTPVRHDPHPVEDPNLGEELTTEQAAKLLNVSRPYVVKLIDSGALPGWKVGRYRWVRKADLIAYREKVYAAASAACDAGMRAALGQ